MSTQSKEIKRKLKVEQKKLAFERKKHHKDVIKFAKEQDKLEKTYDGNAYISLKNINKIYPNHVQAVYDFNLEIQPNEFIVFVGPSGCGKSTTLRMIAGLEEITSGFLFVNGEYANELPPKDRGVTMVFQSYALYPHMTVYDNMAFALKIQHFKKAEIDERIHKAAKILELEEYLDRKPSALSGGQCQRVALGRAIVTDARIFLMDEPLSNLDAKLRVQMRSEIVKLHKSVNATTIYVTHDQTEAMTMANRIVVMNKGLVQQIGTPDEIFNYPANLFVATFIGAPAMNIFDVTLSDKGALFANGYNLKLGKDTLDKVDAFYKNEIELTKAEIEKWKVEFLNRLKGSYRYTKVFTKNGVNRIKLVDLLNEFENNEEILKELNLVSDDQNIVDKVDAYLKEAIYNEEGKTNPIIIKLNDTFAKLNEALNSKDKLLKLGIRPEHLMLGDKTDSMKLSLNLVELLGSEYYLHLNFMDKEVLVRVDNDNEKTFNVNDVLPICMKKDRVHLFDPITEKNIDFVGRGV